MELIISLIILFVLTVLAYIGLNRYNRKEKERLTHEYNTLIENFNTYDPDSVIKFILSLLESSHLDLKKLDKIKRIIHEFSEPEYSSETIQYLKQKVQEKERYNNRKYYNPYW